MYLKNEPFVGFTKSTPETLFCATNGLGIRNGGIIKAQFFSDWPHRGHASGNFVKKIFI